MPKLTKLTKEQVDAMPIKDVAAALLEKNIKFPCKWDWRDYRSDAKECPMVTAWNAFMSEAKTMLHSVHIRNPEDMCDLDLEVVRVGDHILNHKFEKELVQGFILGQSRKLVYVRDVDFKVKQIKKESIKTLKPKVFAGREIWISLIEEGF